MQRERDLAQRISELEAENRRLRGALLRFRDCVDSDTFNCVDSCGNPQQSRGLSDAMANADRVLARATLSQEQKP